uniref:Uncharacterized protein n=2 Tax=Tardiphaga robiniae TaxID=943830 RepID=A0A109ZY23_9BRAD|nr:hypothetical protein PROKKA_00593 [Tardiphaga robiniae]
MTITVIRNADYIVAQADGNLAAVVPAGLTERA